MNDSEADKNNENALVLLTALKRKLAAQLQQEDKDDSGFRKRCYQRWKPGMNLLRRPVLDTGLGFLPQRVNA